MTDSLVKPLPKDVCPSCITYNGHEPGCIRAWTLPFSPRSEYRGSGTLRRRGKRF